MNDDLVQKFMIENLGARTLAWEIPGPKNTGVATIQCWNVPTTSGHSRLVLVENFDKGGFEIFPQIFGRNDMEKTAHIINHELDKVDPS